MELNTQGTCHFQNRRNAEHEVEAQSVLAEGKKLWRQYHTTQFEKRIRDEYKLGRPDVGWYQIRKALGANADNETVDFAPFKEAYDALSAKLRPQVYSLGFLKH